MAKQFSYGVFDVVRGKRYEALNDVGRWIECIGGLDHAQAVARQFGTAYRVVNLTQEVTTYKVKD